jgi:hypothetical protein
MDNPNSPLDTLRQLKEMLDTGALTPAEFEALKQRLVFSASAAAPTLPAAPEPAAPKPALEPLVSLPPPVAEQHSPMFEAVAADETPTNAPPAFTHPAVVERVPIVPPGPPVALTPEPEELEADEKPIWAAANSFPAHEEEPPSSSPLALILSIGGVLVFLAVVAYLSFNRPQSEHISSTSKTEADSLAAPIETGPQAEQLSQAAAVPETIRVAPTNPAPPIQPRPTPALRDSATAVPPTAPPDSAVSR